jgi:pimeloyl-ACP methyl ester carboxylesterase
MSGTTDQFEGGCINRLRIHILEACFEPKGRPLVLLLHGIPELAYSWRKIMLPIAAAGLHVVAPDLRGYGPGRRHDGRRREMRPWKSGSHETPRWRKADSNSRSHREPNGRGKPSQAIIAMSNLKLGRPD